MDFVMLFSSCLFWGKAESWNVKAFGFLVKVFEIQSGQINSEVSVNNVLILLWVWQSNIECEYEWLTTECFL